MKIVSVAAKTVKEYLRNRRTLLLAISIPVAFMVIFGLAFGSSGNSTTYNVATYNADGGAAPLFKAMADAAYPGGQHIFSLSSMATRVACVNAVVQSKAVLCVDVPNGFQSSRVDVKLHADPSNVGGQIASDITTRILLSFNGNQRVTAQAVPITAPGLTAFDFIAPGLMVFAVMNLVPQVASILSREVEQGTLLRLRLTRLSVMEFLAGVTLGQIAITTLSVALMLAAAAAMGFQFGSWDRAAIALLVAFVTALAVTGIGLIIAAFSRKSEHAAGLGVLVAVPGSFLSGAFFPMPAINLFSIAGRTFQLYDILPTTHAVRALRAILTLRQGIGTIWFDLTALAALSILYFAVGSLLYSRIHFRSR